jgi:hypothetical protein
VERRIGGTKSRADGKILNEIIIFLQSRIFPPPPSQEMKASAKKYVNAHGNQGPLIPNSCRHPLFSFCGEKEIEIFLDNALTKSKQYARSSIYIRAADNRRHKKKAELNNQKVSSVSCIYPRVQHPLPPCSATR